MLKEAEVVVAAAKLLAAQRRAEQQQRIHSGKSRMFLNNKTIDATTWIILCDYFNLQTHQEVEKVCIKVFYCFKSSEHGVLRVDII